MPLAFPATPRAAALGLLAAAAVVLPVSPAAAHTDLTGTSVDAGLLPAGAQEVVLRFRGEVRPELSSVVVTGPDGRDRGAGRVQARGDQVVRRLAAPLPAGSWTLSYRVVAGDGHPLTGSLPFRVEGAAAVAAPAAAIAPTRTGSDAVAAAAGTLLTGTLVAGGLLAAVRRRRRA